MVHRLAGPANRLRHRKRPQASMPPMLTKGENLQLPAAARQARLSALRAAHEPSAKTMADEHGEWVLIPDEPLAPGKHALSLFEIDPISKRGISGQRSITLSIASRQTRGATRHPKVDAGVISTTERAACKGACLVFTHPSGHVAYERVLTSS